MAVDDLMRKPDFEKLVEERIQEALANGEFGNLPGRGLPLDVDSYFSAPEDLRMAYTVLKNARILPEEVQLLHDLGALQAELDRASTDAERTRIRRCLSEKTAQFNLLMERYRLRRRQRL